MKLVFEILKNTALLHKAGGGPGVFSGAISFMKVYNTSIEDIKQGGHCRANMGILHINRVDF